MCLVGSLPYLIDKLLKRQLEPEPFNRLGKAARNLLGYALSAIANPNFVAVCIPLVADTYSTDPAASRALLERVLDPERLEKFAYIEVPALARKIAEIAKQDTEFAVSIYARTFAHRVDSERTRSFNREQIMPMSGRESDMYGTASYSLAQHFPKFFEDSPAAATEAVVAIIEGHVATRHAIAESVEEKSLQIGGTTAKLIDDGSRYGSWEIDLAHPDATGMILLQHMTNLQSADEEKAIESCPFSLQRTGLHSCGLGFSKPERRGRNSTRRSCGNSSLMKKCSSAMARDSTPSRPLPRSIHRVPRIGARHLRKSLRTRRRRSGGRYGPQWDP